MLDLVQQLNAREWYSRVCANVYFLVAHWKIPIRDFAAPLQSSYHAGLECGVIGEKYPGMQMISFGPQIESPHSPNERVQISSVETYWKYLKGLLEQL